MKLIDLHTLGLQKELLHTHTSRIYPYHIFRVHANNTKKNKHKEHKLETGPSSHSDHN